MGALSTKIKNGALLFHNKNVVSINKSRREDPDERWSNLYRDKQRNHLYKWIDTKGHGELLTIYEREGEEGIHRFASETVPTWLYNDGLMPEILKQDDYIKWRKIMYASLTGGEEISETEILESIGGKYVEHSTLWKLNKRGIDGETIIHLLLSRDDSRFTEIAEIMLRIHPGLSTDIYEGDEFYGQSPLHQSIVHDDYECVQVLVQAGADIAQRATGKFFLPEDQKTIPKAKATNYAGFAYYGEYPLAFAASFGNKDIYDFLIQNGADPNWQDTFGNTVLHMCVINNSIEMYSYAVRHWAKPADDNICNNAGYTPLTLATILGRKEIFEAMLELTKVEFWRFSDMTCSGYPLTTLDTIRHDGSTNWDSALMRVVNGATNSHLDIVGCDVIQRLLADKWRLFGGRKMYERLALQVLHILCLSLAIYTRPDNADYLLYSTNTIDYVRYTAESATLICTLYYILYQQTSEIQAQGFQSYSRSMGRAPEKTIFLAANFLILLAVPCRILKMYLLEEICLTLAVPGFWISMLFFAKGFLMTGPFVIMIYSMVSGDMIRFSSIVLIFLVSFSQGFFFLGKDIADRDNAKLCGFDYDSPARDYDYYWETALTLFRMALGGYDYEKLYCASYPSLAKLLFVVYMIIMPIMLINMLIAMMGNTYERVIAHAEKAWRQQWAQIVILLERSLHKKKLAKLQQEYSIKLNDDRYDDNDGDNNDIRGLMVIKRTKQTRAKQRKQATSTWKRLGRKVLGMLRNQGVEKTRRTLHKDNCTTDSRPPSATGRLLQFSENNTYVDRKSSISISATNSRKEEHKNHTGDTQTQAQMNKSESPQLIVHRKSTPSHSSLDKAALLKKLNSLEHENQNRNLAGKADEQKCVTVVDEYTNPNIPLSSPVSLSDADAAIDKILNAQDTNDQIQRRLSTNAVSPLHPLALEHLPRSRQMSGNRKGRFGANSKFSFSRQATVDQIIHPMNENNKNEADEKPSTPKMEETKDVKKKKVEKLKNRVE